MFLYGEGSTRALEVGLVSVLPAWVSLWPVVGHLLSLFFSHVSAYWLLVLCVMSLCVAWMRFCATYYASQVLSSFCWLVCLLVMTVNSGKTADSIEMPFDLRCRVGPRNRVLDGGQDPPWGNGQIIGGMGQCNVTYRKNAFPAMRPVPKLLLKCYQCYWDN